MLSLVIFFSTLLFVLILISLGFRPAVLTRMTGLLLLFTAVAGIGCYGYGYSVLLGNAAQAIIRTLFSVFCMFLGRNELKEISQAAPLNETWAQVLLYAVHLFALYCSASALVSSLGANLLRRLNLLLVRRGNLNLIYGITDESLDFAEALQKEKPGAVVFVGTPGQAEERILHMGAIAFSDSEAKTPTAAFLARLGLPSGQRSLSLYCLGEDSGENERYAALLLEELRAADIDPARTSLTLLSEEENGAALQVQGSAYGYGTVFCAERYTLLARLLIRTWPPARWMRFDADGRAEEDFRALIVGFGRTGQAVLRALVMNAQFTGSRFHATVIDLDYKKDAGSFFARYPALQEQYDIEFLDEDAHSVAAFRRLRELAPELNYAVIAAGSAQSNDKLSEEYRGFLNHMGCQIPLLLVSGDSVRASTEAKEAVLCDSALLSPVRMDAAAMLLNHQYHKGEEGTAQEHWAACDYFSRMSCRASADFTRSFLTAIHTTQEEVRAQGLRLTPAQLEALSEMEHLRWCAFHYAMGYRPMPEEVFQRRAAAYRRGELSEKPGKDPRHRLHACLTDWDALNELSRREWELAGRQVDYQEQDRENVRMLPELLRAEAEQSEKG